MYSQFVGKWFFVILIVKQCILVKSFDNLKFEDNFSKENSKTEHNKYFHPEFFGILHRLEDYSNWAQKEEFIVTVARRRLLLVQEEIKLMENYLDDYKDSSGKAVVNLRNRVSNNTSGDRSIEIASSSVLAHRMTHRFSSIVKQLKNWIGFQYHKYTDELLRMVLKLPANNVDKILNIFEHDLWIGYNDVFMSISALIKNQETYGLNANDFMSNAGSALSPVGLSLQDCIEIGMFALHRQKYYLAVYWLELAKHQTTKSYNEHNFIHELAWSEYKDVIELLLHIGIQEHNRQKLQLTDRGNDTNDESLNLYVTSIAQHESHYDRISFRDFLQYSNDFSRNKSNTMEPYIQFMKLCQVNFYQEPEHTARLKCYYESRLHHYLFICPVKVEQLSKLPPINQYYEVLGSETIKNILNNNLGFMALMPPELEIIRPGVKAIEVDDRDRTSTGIGLRFQNLPKKIFTSAEIVTGFNIWNSSDIATFAEYTYGRFYTYHGDVHAEDDKNREKTDVPKLKNNVGDDIDRMGTMLYYLEEPEVGGYTPFFQAGIAARAVKGSVVVWFNFYRNGTIRKDVYHGACPVIHGSKIMMHHWIRHVSNWNQKCSLNQYD